MPEKMGNFAQPGMPVKSAVSSLSELRRELFTAVHYFLWAGNCGTVISVVKKKAKEWISNNSCPT